METLVPWTEWGRYEDLATEGNDDHQVVHVDFGSIEYEYEEVKRKFVVHEVLHADGGLVVIKAS